MLTANSLAQDLPDYLAASEAARLRGDYQQGALLAQQAADAAAAADLPAAEATALCLMANQLIRIGAHERAAEACGRAGKLEQAIGHDVGVAQALTMQAMAYMELGLQEEALQVLTTSLEIAQRLREPSLLFWAYNRIGNAQGYLGNHLESRGFLLRALPFSTGLGAEAKFCILNNLASNGVDLATWALEQGNANLVAETIAAGLSQARTALDMARAAEHPYREAICLGNFGMLLALNGQEEPALQAITRSHAIATDKGYTSLRLDAGYSLARIAELFGNPDQAIDRFETVLPELMANDEKPKMLQVHQRLSDLYQHTDRPVEALSHYKKFHALESSTRSAIADTRARMATSMIELSTALLEAERAKLETRLHQMQLAELETEKRDLLIRASDLDRKAHEDDLTGLKNRRYAYSALNDLIATSAAGQTIFVGIVDADHFKKVNDRFGHAIGDDVLRRLAAILSAATAIPGSFAARLGGEEFLLVFSNLSAADALDACETLCRAIADEPWDAIALSLRATASIGLTLTRGHEDITQVLSRADAALYRSKSGGRNRVSADL
ncbi:diguanylate cyclase [Devosia sp.]|uniref:GGDEF domain-containing protein n=1 Tax=Devosia sp. TaxID=1871048 RepID=UPI003267A6D1